jgi:glycosyltransferase involved in cell wall biosynthesis
VMKKYNIVFDNIIFDLQRRGGGSIYWAELISRVSSDSGFRPSFISGNRMDNIAFKNYTWDGVVIGKECATSLFRFFPPRYKSGNRHVFHSSYYRYSNCSTAVNVSTIHDFTHELFMSGIRASIHHKMKSNAIRKSKEIICVSQNTKNDLLRLFREVDPVHVHVVYNGASPEYHPLSRVDSDDEINRRYGLEPKGYVLFVGHRTSYKNFNIVVEAVRKIGKYRLAIVGNELAPFEKRELDRLIPNRYSVYSDLSNTQLNSLYNSSFCLVYPSSYEGFGIPLVEAMSAGCPVVCSASSSLPEVGGEAVIYLDSLSVDQCVEKICSLEDESLRRLHIALGIQQAKKFSWNKCVEETMAIYRQALEGD